MADDDLATYANIKVSGKIPTQTARVGVNCLKTQILDITLS